MEDITLQPLSMTSTTVGYDFYLRRTCTTRIYLGQIDYGGNTDLCRRLPASSPMKASHVPPLALPLHHTSNIVLLAETLASMAVGTASHCWLIWFSRRWTHHPSRPSQGHARLVSKMDNNVTLSVDYSDANAGMTVLLGGRAL